MQGGNSYKSAGDNKAERGELQSIHVEPIGEGEGVMTHTHYMRMRGGQGGGPSHDVSEEKHHHPTLESLHSHFKEHLKQSFNTTDEKETDGYEHEPGTEAEE